MTLIVAKPFNSAHQRFREGDPVSEDADFSPLNIGDLNKRNFIVSDDKKPAKAD